WNKLVCHINRPIHIPTGITLKIKDQLLHTLFFQRQQSLFKFIKSVSREPAYFYIAHLVIYHIAHINRVLGYTVSCNFKIEQISLLAPLYSQLQRAPLLS